MVTNDSNVSNLRMMLYGLAVVLLLMHFYYFCYGLFSIQHLTSTFMDRFISGFEKSGLFKNPASTKLSVVGFIFCALILTPTPSTAKKTKGFITSLYLSIGMIIYIGSDLLVKEEVYDLQTAMLYLLFSILGLLILMRPVKVITARIVLRFSRDIFNEANETFPQTEELIENPYSVNIRARYRLRNAYRDSWINVSSFRGTAVVGTAGSGKTVFVIRHFISQWIQKHFTLFVFDFKFDDLTRIAYNLYLKYKHLYPKEPKFYVVDFDHLELSHRCNPLDPASMEDLSDAAESARTILLALNREWVGRQGDFFIESAISFITAAIWFLRKFEDGKFCTLPHLIEIIQYDYSKLFSVLRSYPEIETLISPFLSAFLNDTMDTLESQAASARIALAGLSSPSLYYILSGNEFTLDINNPKDPKIICMGSNPQKQQVYGAVLSLYITRMIKLVNKRGQLPSGIVLDELSTIYFPGLPNLLATARSNKVGVVYGIQSLSLLRSTYGKDNADVLFDLPGNVFCGQSFSDTAKLMSTTIGKILQPKQSVSFHMKGNSINQSEQLDFAVPPSRISSLSSGEFVGYVADSPDQKIKTKAFYGEIPTDFVALAKEEESFQSLPKVSSITKPEVDGVFFGIKDDVKSLINRQLAHMQSTPSLATKIVVKEVGQQFRKRQ